MEAKTALVLIPTFSQTIEQRICIGIRETLSKAGVHVLFAQLNYLPEEKTELAIQLDVHRQLKALKPDIVLAYGGGLSYRCGETILRQVLEVYKGIPVVNLGITLDEYPCVAVNNYVGMHTLMLEIVRRKPDGRFLYVSGPPKNADNILRQKALEDALSSVGRTLNAFDIAEGDFTASVAYKVMEDYLQGSELPHVIVCANDLNAKGVLDCLAHQKISVPDDCWVTGFDDFEYAASMEPGLTTVHFPARAMGAEGANQVLEILRKEASEQSNIIVDGYPIYRSSTGDEKHQIGDYENEIKEQWAIVQMRDNVARKLAVLRNFQRNMPISELIRNAKDSLVDLQVDWLSVFTKNFNDEGKVGYLNITMDGLDERNVFKAPQIPDAFYSDKDDSYWLICPLLIEDTNYGYLLAKCASYSAEFVEFISPQLTELLHTESLEARNENYRLQTELNERMVSLGSLVSGVAHEVNTPIGTGKLAASSLIDSIKKIRKKVDDQKMTRSDFDLFVSECDEFSHIIYQSLDRAAELISNFKMVSVDQTAEEKRKFDLGEYVNSVLISLRHQLKGTQIQLKTELEEDIVVDGYPGAVAQVLTNLFMNAIKHGFEDGSRAGEITIVLRKLRRGFSLIVADNGKGVSEDVLSHIFDPFFTTSRGEGGSGLGMHIVFNLVSQKLGWSIKLNSKPNKGFKAILKPLN